MRKSGQLRFVAPAAMRRLIVLFVCLLGLGMVAETRWIAAAREKPAANHSDAPVKTIDLFTANELHKKLESLPVVALEAGSEGLIMVHYEGPLGKPAGSPGLRADWPPEKCLSWSVAYYKAWPKEVLAVQLFEITVSRDPQLDTIVTLTINGEELHIQAEVGGDPGLNKPMPELGGITVSQCVKRVFGTSDTP